MRKLSIALGILVYFLVIGLWHFISDMRIEVFVALLGIGGVLATLYVNTLLSLHQQDTQWKNETKRRDEERNHKRTALRIVLLEELKDLRSVYTEGIKTLDDCDETSSVLVPKAVNDTIFSSTVSHIGILTKREVREVVATYRALSRQNTKTLLLGTTEGIPDDYVQVQHDLARVLLSIKSDVISKLDNTVKVLSENLTNTKKT